MKPGDRIVVVGGPWPERRGCHGMIVGPPDDAAARLYPFNGLGFGECVILLDDDPLAGKELDPERPFAYTPNYRQWSCVIHQEDLKVWRIAEHVGEVPAPLIMPRDMARRFRELRDGAPQ